MAAQRFFGDHPSSPTGLSAGAPFPGNAVAAASHPKIWKEDIKLKSGARERSKLRWNSGGKFAAVVGAIERDERATVEQLAQAEMARDELHRVDKADAKIGAVVAPVNKAAKVHISTQRFSNQLDKIFGAQIPASRGSDEQVGGGDGGGGGGDNDDDDDDNESCLFSDSSIESKAWSQPQTNPSRAGQSPPASRQSASPRQDKLAPSHTAAAGRHPTHADYEIGCPVSFGSVISFASLNHGGHLCTNGECFQE